MAVDNTIKQYIKTLSDNIKAYISRVLSVHNADSNAHKSLFDAWLEDLYDAMYPIGSIYLTMSSDNPSLLFGGTWERIESRFLYGSINGQGVGTTGGEETHTLTVNEMPSHRHKVSSGWQSASGTDRLDYSQRSGGYNDNGAGLVPFVENTGGGQAHNNMPPYIMVNIWKRTA